MTKEDYERNLEENLAKLVKRMKSGSYRPNPTRRVYIPKETKGKMRPLGISCYEDKLVENAIAQILEQIYEPKFYNESFGFRPNRNCHQAVREIIEMVQYRKTNYVVEADIRGFFDNVDHGWLMKMLSHDIADRRFLELIEKFLKAGIMENGKLLDSERGTPQGNGASPVLANVYLHYVLDNWFDVIVKRQCKGECYLIRYCDDFVCCFQNQYEAEVFRQRLEERFRKYGLELAEEKLQITLALSLHGATQEKRRKLMPIANKYELSQVLAACDAYFEKTGRRVTFEYSLVHGVNDTPEDAGELTALLKHRNCHLNLIPVNPVKERNFVRPSRENALNFKNNLEKSGINVTIRREMGSDIDGACGQLRRRRL